MTQNWLSDGPARYALPFGTVRACISTKQPLVNNTNARAALPEDAMSNMQQAKQEKHDCPCSLSLTKTGASVTMGFWFGWALGLGCPWHIDTNNTVHALEIPQGNTPNQTPHLRPGKPSGRNRDTHTLEWQNAAFAATADKASRAATFHTISTHTITKVRVRSLQQV